MLPGHHPTLLRSCEHAQHGLADRVSGARCDGVHRDGGGDQAVARWPLDRVPHLLETSLPGVFAVGEVRSGSLKRVAAAVGEGSAAIAFVHQVLRE